MQPIHIVVSSEHGGNNIPVEYGQYFKGAFDILNTHRGWDIGSLKIADTFATRLNTRLISTNVSRLVVDCNRSIGNMNLYSVFTENLSGEVHEQLLNKYYHPYRNQVKKKIDGLITDAIVIHLSIHTYTPILNGAERKMDLGILFDDKRTQENSFCQTWLAEIKPIFNGVAALNEPYHGADDGLTTHFRKAYPAEKYLGIELELNQKWVGSPFLDEMVDQLITTLENTITKENYVRLQETSVIHSKVN